MIIMVLSGCNDSKWVSMAWQGLRCISLDIVFDILADGGKRRELIVIIKIKENLATIVSPTIDRIGGNYCSLIFLNLYQFSSIVIGNSSSSRVSEDLVSLWVVTSVCSSSTCIPGTVTPGIFGKCTGGVFDKGELANINKASLSYTIRLPPGVKAKRVPPGVVERSLGLGLQPSSLWGMGMLTVGVLFWSFAMRNAKRVRW